MIIRKNTPSFPKTLVIGSSGFIGSGILNRWQNTIKRECILTPSESDLDILDSNSLQKIISGNKPEAIINLAANTNLEEAEKERGDRKGPTWKLNAEAIKNLAKTCKKLGIFLVQISTDAVFPGTSDFPGPYSEDTKPPDNLKPLSWYAYTKLASEKAVLKNNQLSAIVRISYPFGNLDSEKDFVRKTIKYIQNGYSLFSDQKFTPTYTPNLSLALEIILKRTLTGVYHIVCTKLTTPLSFGENISKKLHLGKVRAGNVTDYLKRHGAVLRPVLGGLTTKQTECNLGIELPSWEKALKKSLKTYNP